MSDDRLLLQALLTHEIIPILVFLLSLQSTCQNYHCINFFVSRFHGLSLSFLAKSESAAPSEFPVTIVTVAVSVVVMVALVLIAVVVIVTIVALVLSSRRSAMNFGKDLSKLVQFCVHSSS